MEELCVADPYELVLGIELHFLWLKGMIKHPLMILIQYIELVYGRDSTLFCREMTIGDHGWERRELSY